MHEVVEDVDDGVTMLQQASSKSVIGTDLAIFAALEFVPASDEHRLV